MQEFRAAAGAQPLAPQYGYDAPPPIPGSSRIYGEEDTDSIPRYRPAPPPARSAPKGITGILGGNADANEPLDTSMYPDNFVFVNVYDISDSELFQKINRVSTANDNVLMGGVFHAGVQIYGAEWSFGFTDEDETGIAMTEPRNHSQHTYRTTVKMGETPLSIQEVEALLRRLAGEWYGPDYNLLHRNCLDFSNAFCKDLGVGRIPGWIDRFGRIAGAIDIGSRKTADIVRRTSSTASSLASGGLDTMRGASTDIIHDVSQVAKVARENSKNLAETAQVASQHVSSSAQALGGSFMRWGSGLLGAALGDSTASASSKPSLKAAIRNRGGVAVAKASRRSSHDSTQQQQAPARHQQARADAEAMEPVRDPFLLEPPESDSQDGAKLTSEPVAQLEAIPEVLEQTRLPSNGAQARSSTPSEVAADAAIAKPSEKLAMDSVGTSGARGDEPLGAAPDSGSNPVEEPSPVEITKKKGPTLL